MTSMPQSNGQPPKRPELTIYLAAPRGFCAGVDRAIQIVELALERYGAPVYVRHAIVHNRTVVEELKAKGAVFVEELDEILPETDAPIIFSAHGVPKSVPETASRRRMFVLDATCPLVAKVHAEARRQFRKPRDPSDRAWETSRGGGNDGSAADGRRPSDRDHRGCARVHAGRDADRLAVLTQTTLSVDDTRGIVAVLKERFPNLLTPRRDDICYATTNRQDAVKRIAPTCERMIVVGSPTSSNSLRLVEVAERAGCPHAVLIERADEIEWNAFSGIKALGLTAGASAPQDPGR